MGVGLTTIRPGRTDASGRFELRLGSTAPVALTAIPPRGGAAIRVASPGDSETIIELGVLSGGLEVRWSAAAGNPFVEFGAARVPVGLVARMMAPQGGVVDAGHAVIPSLEVGRYRICLPSSGDTVGSATCTPVDVLPNAQTLVDLTADHAPDPSEE
jgi:hypothetical protein